MKARWQPQRATNRPAPTAYQWLGLHLLAALRQIIPLPYPPPHAELEALSAHVPLEEQAQMAALAEQLIAGSQSAIRGRDAFFPVRKPVPPEWIETIRAALAREQAIDLTYQALGECAPTCRRVYPLRLEEWGALHYLHAYCTLAEANRTFRLDRIVSLALYPEVSKGM
jgi:predicted DNA-binding transcriptional regulator YafY